MNMQKIILKGNINRCFSGYEVIIVFIEPISRKAIRTILDMQEIVSLYFEDLLLVCVSSC